MKHLITLLFLAGSLICSAQHEKKFNLDFEQFNPEENLADGWFKWGNYELTMDTLSHSGKYSGKIESEQGESFGSIAYKIPANYTGRSVQLEGYMKTENVENGFAGLLLRVDGNGASLAFDNMQNSKIQGTNDWKKYMIKLPFSEEAEVIYVAGIMVGSGKAWFDDFVLSIDGQDVQTLKEAEKPVFPAKLDTLFDEGSKIEITALHDELVANLDLLGKIWGFLKYHHPEVGKGNYNWDYELFRALQSYLEVRNNDQRDQVLLNWIEKYGAIPDCTECQETSPDAFLKPDLTWIKESKLSADLENKLNEIYQNRHQGKHYYIGKVAGVGNPIFSNENAYPDMPYPDDGFRLLALYRFWNIIQYFFPNRHLIDEDWSAKLKEYIPKFVNASNELEYELAAIQIIGYIKYTHANLWRGADKLREERGNYYAPFHVRFIEDKLVVTDYYNPELQEQAGLAVGDVITHINSNTVESIVDSLIPYYPASNKPARLRDIAADLLRSKNDKIDIQFTSGRKKKNKSLDLYPADSLNIYRWYRRDEEKSFKLLEDNIGYITLKTIKSEDIPEIKKAFIDTEGIIIDIRNYPSTFVPFLLGSYFVSSPTPFVKFTTGNIDNPGEFTFTEPLEIPPAEETYTSKLVILVNELSQSQAEYTAMAFRARDDAMIIGSTTAGADGNVSNIHLPGGMRTMISGIGVYYPDGSETQRIGIVPDIEVKPTIQGIREGRDELLEKAIELIKQ